jgi:Ser/Thr protein kinase RdoA (MazF antagonist)
MDVEALALQAAKAWPIITAAPELVVRRENIVFKVDTREGPHALRLHRKGYHSAHIISSELAYMAMLADRGFTVPKPAQALSDAFVVDVEGHLFSLLSWLPGKPFGTSSQPLTCEGALRLHLMQDIGRKLAQLHGLTDEWQTPAGFERPRWHHAGLLGEAPFWGRFWTAGFLSTQERVAMDHLRAKCQVLLHAYDRAGADCGLIHADLARENILVHDSQVSFIDFDDCGFGYRMFDIATALIKNIHESDYPELRAALLEGYQSRRPIAEVDLQSLDLMMLLRSLTYIGWVDARLNEPNMAVKAQRFLADVKLLAARLRPGVF